MDVLGNRRAHLIAALTLFAVGVAAALWRAVDIPSISPTAFEAGVATSVLLGGLLIAAVSRMERHITVTVTAGATLIGAIVSVAMVVGVFRDRPNAALSFAGVPYEGPEVALLGAFVGTGIGLLLSAFAVLVRPIARRAPELGCVLAWALAATACVAAGAWLFVLPCAIGAAIQLARRFRLADVTHVHVGPYR